MGYIGTERLDGQAMRGVYLVKLLGATPSNHHVLMFSGDTSGHANLECNTRNGRDLGPLANLTRGFDGAIELGDLDSVANRALWHG